METTVVGLERLMHHGLVKSSPRATPAADLAIKLATVGLLAWAILSPDLPQF